MDTAGGQTAAMDVKPVAQGDGFSRMEKDGFEPGPGDVQQSGIAGAEHPGRRKIRMAGGDKNRHPFSLFSINVI